MEAVDYDFLVKQTKQSKIAPRLLLSPLPAVLNSLIKKEELSSRRFWASWAGKHPRFLT